MERLAAKLPGRLLRAATRDVRTRLAQLQTEVDALWETLFHTITDARLWNALVAQKDNFYFAIHASVTDRLKRKLSALFISPPGNETDSYFASNVTDLEHRDSSFRSVPLNASRTVTSNHAAAESATEYRNIHRLEQSASDSWLANALLSELSPGRPQQTPDLPTVDSDGSIFYTANSQWILSASDVSISSFSSCSSLDFSPLPIPDSFSERQIFDSVESPVAFLDSSALATLPGQMGENLDPIPPSTPRICYQLRSRSVMALGEPWD